MVGSAHRFTESIHLPAAKPVPNLPAEIPAVRPGEHQLLHRAERHIEVPVHAPVLKLYLQRQRPAVIADAAEHRRFDPLALHPRRWALPTAPEWWVVPTLLTFFRLKQSN